MSRSLYLLICCSFLLTCLALDAQAQIATLSPGQTHNGTLRSSDLATDDGKHFQCFDLNAQLNQEVVVTLRSRQFDTILTAGTGRCSGGLELTMINDDFESSSTDSQLRFMPTQQENVLVITSYGTGSTGNFTLSVDGPGATSTNSTSSGDTPYHVGTISTGQHYSGNLSSNSMALDDGQYVQCVNLDFQANQQATVTLRSSQFDTQLYIGTGRCLGDFNLTMVNDDFESGSTDSQLQFTASQNQYMAIVSSYGARETGSYMLSVEGTTTGQAANTTDEELSPADAYLRYGTIPDTIPEDLILGTATGDQRIIEHPIQFSEEVTPFIMAICDYPTCMEIYVTLITPDGSEIHGEPPLGVITYSSGILDLLGPQLPPGQYRVRVNLPNCTGSCRYTVSYSSF